MVFVLRKSWPTKSSPNSTNEDMQKLFCSCPVQAAAAEQYLKSRSPQWTDDLHHLRPGSGDAKYVSTGQIRERGEFQDYPALGAWPPDTDIPTNKP